MNDDKCYSEGCVEQRRELARLRDELADLREKLNETCDLFLQEQRLRHEYGTKLAEWEARR